MLNLEVMRDLGQCLKQMTGQESMMIAHISHENFEMVKNV